MTSIQTQYKVFVDRFNDPSSPTCSGIQATLSLVLSIFIKDSKTYFFKILQNGIANAKMRLKMALPVPHCIRSPFPPSRESRQNFHANPRIYEDLMKLVKRYFNPPIQSFFLFGPRGTGKSTLVQEYFKDALWIDLLLPDVLRSYSAYPERLFDIMQAEGKKTIVIDEVQKVPSLLNVVHASIEKDKSLQFILTGSSSRKLKRTGADLLGGRALQKHLHPFMASELKHEFSLENALHIGLLPVLMGAKDPKASLQAYVGLYLKEEIQAEGLVRNLESFSRFLEIISFSHGTILNISNIARECEVKRKTVENYIEILEELLLAFKLPVFSKRAKRELSIHPKFYLFDAGVFRSLRPKGPLDRVEEIEGVALEGLVAQQLRAWNSYSTEPHDVAFWRTRSGLEVDFVVYGPLGFWALEVKNAKKVFAADTKPLEAFLEDYPMAKAILLYRGKERIMQGKVLCLPVEEFLMQIIPNEPILRE
jgi:predicted AAA+ superfamily ATPase